MAPRSALAADTTLVKALAREFRWRRMLETGRFGTIDELAAAEKINSSYVSQLLRLTLLVPDIVEAILDGRQPENVTLPGLMEPFPVEWGRQGDPSQQTTPITALQAHPLANAHRRPGQTRQRRS
jgi:hypothetical protein